MADKSGGFAPSGCRLSKGRGKSGIKKDSKGREVEGRNTFPSYNLRRQVIIFPALLMIPQIASRLWSHQTSWAWADAASLLCCRYHPLWIFPRSVISSEVVQYLRWKSSMAWCRSIALSILSFLPPLIAPAAVAPLLAAVVCWADSCRQLPTPRSHFGHNSWFSSFHGECRARLFSPYVLYFAFNNIECQLPFYCCNSALGAPSLAQPQLFAVGCDEAL